MSETQEEAPRDLEGLVYQQLRAIAHARMLGERAGHPMHTTALVHEALLKLTQDGRINLENRPGFFRAAAAAMRQILIDHARAAGRLKRGGAGADGGAVPVKRASIDITRLVAGDTSDPADVLAIDEVLERLVAHDPRAAEVVRLRFYGGLTMDEAAETMGVSVRTAERLWTYARAWLWRELNTEDA